VTLSLGRRFTWRQLIVDDGETLDNAVGVSSIRFGRRYM
jgi:hypothetical protein